jgi:hypothetical protein
LSWDLRIAVSGLMNIGVNQIRFTVQICLSACLFLAF